MVPSRNHEQSDRGASETASSDSVSQTIAGTVDAGVELVDTMAVRAGRAIGVTDETVATAIPKAYSVALTSGLVIGRVAAQSSGSVNVCNQSEFIGQALPFFLTAGGTFLVGAYALSQLIGGGGQALTMSSGKQGTFKQMQMRGHKGFISALVGLSMLGIMMGWMAFPVDTSCLPGV
ncbi:hypothetical protein ACFFQF_32150 [Haladaptatus pallidirubidus]|uniref:Uncharacterized protein n=1 Tax=Haladaptatus pallidirubidus TaxID=1008152 RepID=A0AAV3UPH6_9EURY|nr:hypothetical protein [Haladaptatus pallidirubidus]